MSSVATTALDRNTSFEFADLTLDTRQRGVFRGGVRIHLPKLTYELLLALAEAAPTLLTHDDLAKRVWPGRYVTPETLAQRVMLLRRALGDDAENTKYLRGVRGLGYQLVPFVHARNFATPHPAVAHTLSRPQFDGDSSLVGDIDLTLPAQPSIVILPFDTVDDRPEHCDFARGMTHDIITRLARTRAFFVIARGSAFRFAGGPHDVREVGRKLGVRYVVQGNIQFSGRHVSINAALADAVEGAEIWAERFHRQLDDVFEIQEDITDLIIGAISAEVEFVEQRRALLETTENLDAWGAYHRGCWHMYRFTPEGYEQAERFFELAATLDPSSSRALAGLSFVHWQRAFLEISRDRPGEVQQAFALAERSVSANPRDPLGHWALGRAHLLRGDMSESIVALSTSTALNPSFAVGQYSLGFALMHAGDTTRSVEMAEKARRLSPYDPMAFAMIGLRGFSLALAGDYDQAARSMALSIRQPNAHYHMVAVAAFCDALAGNEHCARRDLMRLLTVRPGYDATDFLRAFRLQQPAHTALVYEAFQRLARLQ